MATKYWLMKAEPNSRIEKGKDVKFSADDFEAAGTTSWEGVRNYEARNLMNEMRVGDKVLFYHSNCKEPGVAGFAEIVKEAFPDYTAWDPAHPYYDPKTDPAAPRWMMVDAAFTARPAHFVPLALLRAIAAAPPDAPPAEVAYIGADGAAAIRGMDLVTRGRLSVQRVEAGAWDAVHALAARGGWDDMALGRKRAPVRKTPGGPKLESKKAQARGKRKKVESEDDKDDEDEEGRDAAEDAEGADVVEAGPPRKRKAEAPPAVEGAPTLRRSTRARK